MGEGAHPGKAVFMVDGLSFLLLILAGDLLSSHCDPYFLFSRGWVLAFVDPEDSRMRSGIALGFIIVLLHGYETATMDAALH
jgi:hypothetical protein